MAGTDCFRKAIAANAIKNGNAVVSCQPDGSFEVIDNPREPNLNNLDAWEDRLTIHYDDTQYYTA